MRLMPGSFLSRSLTGIVSILFSGAGCTPDTDKPFQIALSQGATLVERAAARVFTERVRIRAGNEPVMMVADASIRSLVVGTAQTNEAIREHPEIDTPGQDGFHMITTPDARGRAYVIGQNPRGVVAGLGKLLRISRMTPGVVTVPAVTLTEAPALPIRGLYIATHFHNFYHSAPLPDVDRIIEDLALWGANSLGVAFTLSEFESFRDPLAQAHLARLRHFGETATSLGMDFGLLLSPNGGYATTPEALRREWIPASPNSFVCPSKAGECTISASFRGSFSEPFRRSTS